MQARQKKEQLLTGGGWIRKGAKSRRVIGRNHSFPAVKTQAAREDAMRMLDPAVWQSIHLFRYEKLSHLNSLGYPEIS